MLVRIVNDRPEDMYWDDFWDSYNTITATIAREITREIDNEIIEKMILAGHVVFDNDKINAYITSNKAIEYINLSFHVKKNEPG